MRAGGERELAGAAADRIAVVGLGGGECLHRLAVRVCNSQDAAHAGTRWVAGLGVGRALAEAIDGRGRG
jgi:hypothetical protein